MIRIFGPFAVMRVCSRISLGGIVLLAGIGICPSPLAADLVKLKSGGEVRGKIVKGRLTRESVTIETQCGTAVTLARDEIQFVTTRPQNVEDYETRLKQLPDTAEAHWEMADWCKQKSLTKQRQHHLLKVIELDSEHQDAHRLLGHVLTKQGWLSRDEMMERQGYVKHRGKFITPQELELLEKTDAERKAEKVWFQKVKLWKGWVEGNIAARGTKPRAGWESLEAITDPNAAPAVIHHLSDHEKTHLRMLSAKILTQIGGDKAVPGLVKLSLRDPAEDVREKATQGLAPGQFARAVPLFVKELRSPSNSVVRRAAQALGMMGNDQTVDPLIDALVTSHVYQIRVPGSAQPTYSFNTNGSFGNQYNLPPELMARIAAGQFPNGVIILDGTGSDQTKYRMVDVTVPQQNAEVLAALEKLTGKNFGYDKRTWHLWWAAQKNQGTKNLLKS